MGQVMDGGRQASAAFLKKSGKKFLVAGGSVSAAEPTRGHKFFCFFLFTKRSAFFATAACLCLGLTGCYPDPFQNPGDWAMTGAAREDTAQQVANKDDLLVGRSQPGSLGVAAAAGVDVAIGGAAGSAAGLQKPPKDISFTSGTGD